MPLHPRALSRRTGTWVEGKPKGWGEWTDNETFGCTYHFDSMHMIVHHHKDILNSVPNLPTTWRSFPIFAAKLEPHQPVWATGPWWLLWTHHEFLPRPRWTAVLQGAEDAGPVATKIGLDWRSNTFWLVMAMVNQLYSYPVVRRELRSYGYSYSLLNGKLRSYQEFPNHILDSYI